MRFFLPLTHLTKNTLGHHLIDVFPNHFSFHTLNKQSNTNFKAYIQSLNNIALNFSSEPSVVLVASDTSIKNHVATSIAHIHVHNKQVIKTIHQVVNITSIETELFTIRCSINQATNLQDIRKIVIIMDSIHSAKKIFNYSLYFFQVHTALISNELRKFFSISINNTIKFWECSCYELKSLEWDKRTTLVLSNTRELDRELFYKLVYLI